MATAKKTTKKKEAESSPPAQQGASESRAIVKAAESGKRAPLIKTVEDLHVFSQAVFKSGYFRDIKSAAQAALRIRVGMELGLPEMASLRAIHYIEKSRDFVIMTRVLGAIARDQGIFWKILTPEGKEKEMCILEIYRPGSKEDTVRVKFDKEDAVRAHLWGKDNFKQYPEEMLYNRALSKGLRMFDPRIDTGYYTYEELSDATPFRSSEEEDEDVQDAEIVEEEQDEEPEEEPEPKQRRQREPGDDDDLVEGSGGKTYTKKMPENGEMPPWADDEEPPPHGEVPEKEEGPEDELDRLKERIVKDIKVWHEAHGPIFGPDGRYDIRMFKKWLSEKQSGKIFVAKNQFGHLSLMHGKLEDLKILHANLQKYFSKFLDDMGIDVMGKKITPKEEGD